MLGLFVTNFYIFILAAVLAILEIQIEGAHGWAKNLPTWRPGKNTWYSKLYEKVMSGRELTGYHLTMFLFVLIIFHLPYVFGLSISLDHWLKTLAFFFMFIVLWDFLWFVLNPFHPLKNFKKEHIWWHKKWVLGLPTDYYGGVIVSGLVLLPLLLRESFGSLFGWWFFNVGLFIILTLITILFSFFVLNIDNWNKSKK